MSKAAVRSKSKRTEQLLESPARRRSLVILSSADSVLCRGVKPDWNLSKMLFLSQVGQQLIKIYSVKDFRKIGEFGDWPVIIEDCRILFC